MGHVRDIAIGAVAGFALAVLFAKRLANAISGELSKVAGKLRRD